MITNADITLFNKYLNRDTKKEEYKQTCIKGIHWYTNQKTIIGEKGLQSADEYKIRIPEDADTNGKEYIDPKSYRKLPTEEVIKYWTIDNGDYFVKGIVEVDITVKELLSSYSCVGKVLSYSDNRFGSTPHFRIGGGS